MISKKKEGKKQYEVIIGNRVEKIMIKLPESDYQRIKKKMIDLGNNPRPPGYIKLKGRDGYRIREGIYRIIYDIEDKVRIVQIIAFGHRKDVYK